MTSHDRPDDRDERLLDAAISAASRGPSDEQSATARSRAWKAIAAEASSTDPCAAFSHGLPGFVAGTLPPDRAELVAAHARECVRCRREWLAATGVPREAAPAPRPASRARRLAAPAALTGLAAALALAAFVGWHGRPHGQAAQVAEVEGLLLLDGEDVPLAVGADIPAGRTVRTAKGSRAVLELADGSRVEMNERAELGVLPTGDALTVDLDRGNVIVAAAKRRERNLFVRTDECTVAVKGTVFTVGHGLKGSRVGVLEGEVHVEQSGSGVAVLRPGQQVATDPALGVEPLEDQVAWSLARERWMTLIGEIEAAAAQVEAEGREPVVRHRSAALEAMPESTVLFAAVPNGGGVARLMEVVEQRVAANPELAAWWRDQRDHHDGAMGFARVAMAVGELTRALGDEIALALILPAGPGAEPQPVLVAPVVDEAGLRRFVESLPVEDGGRRLELLSLEKLAGADGGVLLHAGHVLAGPRAALEVVAAGLDGRTSPVRTPFLDELGEQYRRGTEVLAAVDFERLVGRVAQEARASDPDGGAFHRVAHALGVDGVRRLVVTAGSDDPGTAVLSFREKRTGVASWLDEPAPMGSLEFVSPETHAVVAAVFKDPELLLADLEQSLGTQSLKDGLERFRAETGLDVQGDLAAPLGGEMAVALDGPILPKPSWKVVVEVYDPGRLQRSIEQLIARAETWRREQQAEEAFTHAVSQGTEGEVHVIAHGALEVHYAFRDGYLVACPTRGLLDSALQSQRLGVSITGASKFRDLLPGGGEHVSLLSYQDLGQALGQLGELAGRAGSAQGIDLAPALAAGGACLVHVRASDHAITAGMSSPNGGAGAQVTTVVRQLIARAIAEEALASAAVGYDDAAVQEQ